jgi:hypothetical protein
MLLMIWIAVIAWRNGFTPALYYLIPYVAIMIGSLWMKLVAMTILPSDITVNRFFPICNLCISCWDGFLRDVSQMKG